jgi:hypothetical protein
MRAFLKQLTQSPDGTYDESRVFFIFVQLLLFYGYIYNGLHVDHFQLMDLCLAETALIPLYSVGIAIKGNN